MMNRFDLFMKRLMNYAARRPLGLLKFSFVLSFVFVVSNAMRTYEDVKADVVHRESVPTRKSSANVKTTPSVPQRSLVDDEADEALRIIRRDYAQVLRVNDADNKWSKCHDEMIGYKHSLECLEWVVSNIDSEVVPTPDAAHSCAKEIETTSHAYVNASKALYKAKLVWMKTNRAKLTPHMVTKPLWRACDVVSCDMPNFFSSEKYEPAMILHVNQLECVKRTFKCSPSGDNVCWLTKLRDRMDAGRPVWVNGGSGRQL